MLWPRPSWGVPVRSVKQGVGQSRWRAANTDMPGKVCVCVCMLACGVAHVSPSQLPLPLLCGVMACVPQLACLLLLLLLFCL